MGNFIAVHYGMVEDDPDHHKNFRGRAAERERQAAEFCVDLERRGFKEVTPYLVLGDETMGYWKLTASGFGDFVDLDG